MPPSPANFAEYADAFSPKVRTLLRAMRRTIKRAAPAAEETISYGIPTFTLHGKKLVWFAAFTAHVGFYPGSAAIAAFKRELGSFKTAKGSVQFAFEHPLPLDLIARIVHFRTDLIARK